MADDGDYDLFGPPPPTKPTDSYESLFPPAAPSTDVGNELFPAACSTVTYDDPNPLFPQQPVLARGPPPPAYARQSDDVKKAGNAIDIILVRNESGTAIACTPWVAAFSYSRFSSSSAGDHVDVLVNGRKLPLPMVLGDKGRCAFPSGLDTPPDDVLAFLNDIIPLDDTSSYASVRFEHRKRYTASVRCVECRLYVWGPDDAVVVADLDGTITISDIEGHIRTLRLGQYDFIHAGACAFFWKLHAMGLRILYLTARPIHWADSSRDHLDQAAQPPYKLPPGPLITNSSGYTGALLTEVVNKNPNVFKQNVLNTIQLATIHGGRKSAHPVFVAGFGNRPTDVIAYEAVGIDAAAIFLIDPTSNLKAVRGAKVFESYADPEALLWLLPKLKPIVPFGLRDTMDSYYAHEVVDAEERKAARAIAKATALDADARSLSRTLSSSTSSSSSRTSTLQRQGSSSIANSTASTLNPSFALHPNRTEL